MEGKPVGTGIQDVAFDTVDQYGTQGDAVARAIRGLGPVPVPIEDSVANMDVLDALFRSERSRGWEAPGSSS
jgi:predicted dehydrogenase